MRMVDEEPQEILHVFVVPEDGLPKKPDYLSITMATLAFFCIIALLGISVFSKAPDNQVSFTLSVPIMHLAPVSRTLRTTAIATGKGHTPATYATGIITFYNGAIYSQIIPVGTILQGSDGISVITTQQAVIPPAAQTTPPTYGHTNVFAHATIAGAMGNIQAGDINQACCVTSVIAQNPYTFTGGRNARDFPYLTKQDITQTISPLLPTLQAQTLSLLPDPQLNSSCVTSPKSSPSVGKEIQTAQVTIVETCSAETYCVRLVIHAITTYSTHFGNGTLTHIQFFVVDVTKEVVRLYVVGQWKPFVMQSFPNTGK